MKVLVVYESLYGNTATVAEVIAEAIRARGLVADARPVSKVSAGEAGAVDLLVVGGPTHAHGMTRAGTRKVGAEDEKNSFAEPTIEPGLREWIGGLKPQVGALAAAFDTRLDKPAFLTGSAAKGIARRLESGGFHMVAEPQSFFVRGENRLEPGQVEHARTWGSLLVDRAARLVRSPA